MRQDKSTRTQLVCDLSRSFVDEHYGDEAGLFSVVWDCFKRFGIKSQEVPSKSLNDLVCGLPFAAQAESGVVSPYVILTLDAVFQELNTEDLAPTLSAVKAAIFSTAKAFGASARLTDQLVENLGPRLHASLESLSIESLRDTGPGHRSETDVWVEYSFEEPSETSNPIVIEDWHDVDSVQESEELSCDRFMLYVDEINRRIECRSWSQRQMRPSRKAIAKVAWGQVPNQQRLLLHAILNSLRTRKGINYKEFVADFPEYGSPSTVKSNLFASCGGILDQIVRAVTNASKLEIIGRIPYCWIRRNPDSSELSPSESS